MRFLCCFLHKDEEGNLVKKAEVHTTKTEDVTKGTIQLLVKLSKDYSIPTEFVNREDNCEGVLYIHPKQEYCPTSLCDLDDTEYEYTYE